VAWSSTGTSLRGAQGPTGTAGATGATGPAGPNLLVPYPPYAIAYAATITVNASSGNNVKITATGALTLAVPTNPTDGQMLIIAVLASGAARVVTLAAGIQLTTGLTATITPASGKVAFIGIRYSVLSGNWTCLAMTAEL